MKVDASKTIHWFKVKCSFYQQEIGIHLWKDVVDFVSKNMCFDYVIEGQTSKRFEGVEAYYENGHIGYTKDYVDNYIDSYEDGE